jgi:8-oxo-dGTP diphosphatase
MAGIVTEFCADAVAFYQGKLVLIERLTYPLGLALPGGRREKKGDELESAEKCAIREFREETGLRLIINGIVGVYREPGRDPRGPKISTAVYGAANGVLASEKYKTKVQLMQLSEIDSHKDCFAFDHYRIIKDWQKMRRLDHEK